MNHKPLHIYAGLLVALSLAAYRETENCEDFKEGGPEASVNAKAGL